MQNKKWFALKSLRLKIEDDLHLEYYQRINIRIKGFFCYIKIRRVSNRKYKK